MKFVPSFVIVHDEFFPLWNERNNLIVALFVNYIAVVLTKLFFDVPIARSKIALATLHERLDCFGSFLCDSGSGDEWK